MRLMLAVSGLLATLLAASAPAIEPSPPDLTPPLILRLDGVLVASREAAEGVGFTAVRFLLHGPGERERWLAVTDARTVGGDHPRLGKDVLDDLAPTSRELVVEGPDDLLDRLLSLPMGTAVRTEGLVRRGARTYLLRSADVREASGDR